MSIMTSKDADLLRLRIAELEREMMDFRTSMARVLSGLYETVHHLESWQRWNATNQPEAVERLKAMRDCIVDHFSMSEFKTMCFDLAISFEDLEGETITDLAREFVLLMNRLGRCPDVVLYCKEHRPEARIML
jgi:hypothetical protein